MDEGDRFLFFFVWYQLVVNRFFLDRSMNTPEILKKSLSIRGRWKVNHSNWADWNDLS
jgi:hypothetical protein